MEEHVAQYLRSLQGHPEGDEARWKERYAPLIEEIRFNQPVREEALRLSVVLVAWRATDGLLEALQHVTAQRGVDLHNEVEVLLIDNSDTPPYLEPARDAIKACVHVQIKMRGNMGLSPARNVGVAHARAPIVCFLDDDGLIHPDYLAKGLSYFDRDADVCAIRSRIRHVRHPYFTTLATHYDRGDEVLEDCLVTEGSMMIRRADYMVVGGFADKLYGHEGIDLTYRLKQVSAHNKVLYVPDVIMRHDYMNSWKKFVEKSVRYGGLDETQERSEELQAFMDEFFARKFPRARLSPDRYVARHVLRGLRFVLQRLR